MSKKKLLAAVVLTAIILGSLTPVLVFVFTRDERYPKRALIF